MRLGRRQLFKMLGLVSGGVGISALLQSKSGRTASAQRAANLKEGEIGTKEWPFDENHIPFRQRKQKVKWPNNAKLVVRVYVTAEWSSTLNREGARYKPDLSVISHNSQYAFNVGIYRAIELVEKHGIKTSLFPHGAIVSAYSDLTKEFHRLGHEITARSLDGSEPPIILTRDREEAVVRQVTDTIAQVTGERPVGWISPGAKCTNKTPEILANLGYLWFGDHNGDDIPFGLRFGRKVIVAVPHRPETSQDLANYSVAGSQSDGFNWPSGRDPVAAFDYFQETFDAYYQTATTEFPLMMVYGIHPQTSCLPDRARFHDKALNYMKGFKDVWFARHRDVAQYWKEHYL